jgi:2-isopropylmalate synthase
VHVSAVLKNQATYEHVKPEAIGNDRASCIGPVGQSNIVYKAREFGIELKPKDPSSRRSSTR